MINIAVLLAVWALAFAVLVLPVRPVGTWMARRGEGLFLVILNVIICLVITFNVVLIGWLVLIVGGHALFPHVESDPLGFGLFFAAVLLFVPAFLALLAGYLRARKVSSV